MLDEKRTQHVTLGCGTLILIALGKAQKPK